METNCSSEVYYNEGIMNYEEGNYELSVENFKKAIELDDSVFDYYYNLGITYTNIEEYDLAIETFNKGVSLNSKDADLYMNLGIAFYNKGEFRKATKAHNKAFFINSCNDENCNYAGIACCALKKYKEAISYFRQAVKLEPNNETYNFNLAQVYYETEKYGLAEECLITISRFNKQNDAVYFLMGQMQLKQRDDDLAKDSFERTLKFNPDHKEAQATLDEINERKASKENRRIVKPKEEVSEAEIETNIKDYLNTATMLLEKKEYEVAAKALQEILTLIDKLPKAATQYKI